MNGKKKSRLPRKIDRDQSLVNAEVDVSRAVFEMNRPGNFTWSKARKTIDRQYIDAHVRMAIESLMEYLTGYSRQSNIQKIEKGK